MSDERSRQKDAAQQLSNYIQDLTGTNDVSMHVSETGDFTISVANRGAGFSELETARIREAADLIGIEAPTGGRLRPDLQEGAGITDQFDFKGNVAQVDFAAANARVTAELERRAELDQFRAEERHRHGASQEDQSMDTEDKKPEDETPENSTPKDSTPEQPVVEEPAAETPSAEDDAPEIVGEQPDITPEQLVPESGEAPVVDEEDPAKPEDPAVEDDTPEIVGEQPDITPEQLAPESGEAPVVDEEDPAKPEGLQTDPLVQDEGADSLSAEEEEALLSQSGLAADQPELQENVFEDDPAADQVDGLEPIGVGPGDPLTEEEQDANPAKPDGVSDHDANEGADAPENDEAAKLYENYKAQQEVDNEWREMNAREHYQKIMRSRDDRQEMDEKYLDDVKGLKYYPESDTLKVNIGFGKNIIDSPQGVQMGSGFFTQESADMVMAVTRTHNWAHERPVKLYGCKSAKNKLWLAAMRQGVEVDPAFQPSKKYLQKWENEKHKYQQEQDNTADDLYPGTGPGEEAAQDAPAGDGGPEQQVAEQSGEGLDAGEPPAQEAAELDTQDTGEPGQPVQETGNESPIPAGDGQDVNEIAQDTAEPAIDAETANATPEEIDEYKASVDAKISAAIDELSGKEDQVENVQTLRETQEALQGGQFDVQTLERVDSALLNQKFNVALSAVKPDSLAGAPVKSADLADSSPGKPRNDSAGKMSM